MTDCCCATGDAGIVQCMARAHDFEHCGPEFADQPWCCGGSDTAKVSAVVAAHLGLEEAPAITATTLANVNPTLLPPRVI